MFKTVIVFAVLLVVKVLGTPLNTRVMTVQEILPEEPCVVQGGVCLRSEQCSPTDTVRLADLCPDQSHSGVVCCYSQW